MLKKVISKKRFWFWGVNEKDESGKEVVTAKSNTWYNTRAGARQASCSYLGCKTYREAQEKGAVTFYFYLGGYGE